MKISVLGSGGWGTALAILSYNCSHKTVLWGKFQDEIETIKTTLFEVNETKELKHYGKYANDPLDWSIKLLDIHNDENGYELLQGKGIVTGELLGGCIELFQIVNGTSVWPNLEEWRGKILVLESSECQPEPDFIQYTLMNLGAQGVLDVISGIVVGRCKNGKYYEEYKEVYKKVLKQYGREDLPVLYNCHFGHAWLWNILPLGCVGQIDCENKTLTLLESGVKD